MELSRRSFLGGTLTVAASAIAGPSIAKFLPDTEAYPVLYGDGVHDDTAALNALFSGAPVWCEGKLIKDNGGTIRLVGGSYRVTGTVFVSRNGTTISGASFVADERFPSGEPIMYVEAKAGSIHNNNMFALSARNEFPKLTTSSPVY